jgi:FMN phosphatase YigB (HAD superfamily)
MKIKAVVFDLGKVLLDFDYATAAEALAKDSALPAKELLAILNQSPLLHQFETGLMTAEEFEAEVRALSGYRGTTQEFERGFGDIFTEIEEMTAVFDRIRAIPLPICLFSNTNALAIKHIAAAFPFYQKFDHHFLSYELRSMKPHSGIYDALESRAGLRGEDLVYLDDRLENIEAARGRGWNVILHANPADSQAQLRGFGLAI